MKKDTPNKQMMTTKNTTWKEMQDHVASLLALQSNGKDINGMVADLQDYFMGSGTEQNVLAGNYLLHMEDFYSYFLVAYSAKRWAEYLENLFPERKEARQSSALLNNAEKEIQVLKGLYNDLQEKHVGELDIMVRDYGKLQEKMVVDADKAAILRKSVEDSYAHAREDRNDWRIKAEKTKNEKKAIEQVVIAQAQTILELKASLYDIMEPPISGEGEQWG